MTRQPVAEPTEIDVATAQTALNEYDQAMLAAHDEHDSIIQKRRTLPYGSQEDKVLKQCQRDLEDDFDFEADRRKALQDALGLAEWERYLATTAVQYLTTVHDERQQFEAAQARVKQLQAELVVVSELERRLHQQTLNHSSHLEAIRQYGKRCGLSPEQVGHRISQIRNQIEQEGL